MGSFEYSPLEDQLRFDVRPTATSYTEYLSFEIYPASDSSAYVDLDWEKLRVYFLVEVDLDKAIEAHMKEILANAKSQDWLARCEAAQYLLDSEKDMPQAMKLIEESIKIRQTPQNLYVKAQMLRWAGSAAEGAKTLDQAIELARRQKAAPAVTKPMENTRAQWLEESQRR
jgi:tetratricopeptide (TPR) repeat protein